ncbi:hypothetical protein RKD37_002665 [Streptomyces ambofaciens]
MLRYNREICEFVLLNGQFGGRCLRSFLLELAPKSGKFRSRYHPGPETLQGVHFHACPCSQGKCTQRMPQECLVILGFAEKPNG